MILHCARNIDKIKMPKRKSGNRTPYRYSALLQLRPGDSAFFRSLPGSTVVHKSASAYGKKYGRKYKSRAVTGGVRVWRVW